MNLENKVIVITGASRGLGKMLAEKLAKRKSQLVLGARTEDQLKSISEETGAIFVVCDVSKERDVRQLLATAVEKFGRIDVWINNAGVRVLRTPIEEVDVVKFHDMVETNLFGTFYGSREALKQMKKQKFGIIVNILSTSALKRKPNTSAYGSSKMAVIGFTEFLRNEVRDSNIQVVGVFPGGFKSGFHSGQIPPDFDSFMPADYVAEKIIVNLESDQPQETLTILKA